MSTIVFNPRLTDAGQAAAFNADNDGLELTLTHVSFGTAHYDPIGTETALTAEVSGKLSIAGASRPTLSQIRMTTVWRAETGTYEIGEVGFWADEILVFVWSKADGEVVGYKTPGVDFVLFNDLGFTQVPAGSINITIDPDASVALAALAAHEGADNAHPQYVRYDVFPASQVNLWAKTITGTGNALVIGLQDGVHVDSYTAGLVIRFKASAQNSGPVTVNIDGKGVAAVRKGGDEALEPADIKVGGVYELVYDGENFQLQGGIGGSGFLTKFDHIATAGQAEFSAVYTPGHILVFQNGRELGEASYTATDGATVVLDTPASLDDDVLVVAFSTFTVADTYTKAESDAKFSVLGGFTYLSASAALSSAQQGVVVIDADGGERAITLPASDSALGVRDFIIRRADNSGNRAKVQASGTDKIKFHTHLNAAGYGFLYLMGAGDWWHLRSDGAGNWWPIGRHDSDAIGRPVFETTTTVSPGGWGVFAGSVFNRADWPWLWDHAQDSGMLTTESARAGMEGGWTSGDGAATFRGPDGRAEFLRLLDDGRAGDPGRAAGSWQKGSLMVFDATVSAPSVAALGHTLPDSDLAAEFGLDGINSANYPRSLAWYATVASTTSLADSAGQSRPHNIAYPGRIKLI